MPSESRCQCGAYCITIPHDAPIAYIVCHCDKCKLTTGSGFHIAAIYPLFDFATAASSPEIVGLFTSSASENGNVIDGYFCKTCGNRLAHAARGRGKEWVSLSAARIIGFDWKAFGDTEKTIHVWTSKALVPIPEGVRRFEEQPEGPARLKERLG
jgi:hypothetical protein